MKTKRIITNEDANLFFNSSLNSIDDALGVAIFDEFTQMISFDFTATLLLSFKGVYAETLYPIYDSKLSDNFGSKLISVLKEGLTKKTTYKYERISDSGIMKFEVKLCKEDDKVYLYIFCFDKLVETEQTLSLISNVTGAGNSIFVGNTWWIDYDYHHHHFYQSDNGPNILGIPLSADKLYSTRKFSTVRENARKVSPFYDECISVEKENFDQVKHNKSDYFGGRTPAVSADGKIVWVEAYGKCLLRYPDGSPRFFIAIDIYLSDKTEQLNQLTIINSLTDIGLINSQVGIWYYQRHFTEGRYFFTNSHINMMDIKDKNEKEITIDYIKTHFAKVTEKYPEHQNRVSDFFETHNRIFSEGLDKYNVIIPDDNNDSDLKWLEVRGTVIKRDEEGNVVLFVGVNVDITNSYNREQELKRLKLQNERLQLAEKLAVKAGNLIVWYQDKTLLQDREYIFGNDVFYQKLGLERNSEGLISVSELLSTMLKGTKKDKKIRKKIITDLLAVYSYKTNSFHDIISKHQNKITGEIVYFSNSVEIEETDEDGNITLVGGIMVDITENIKREEKIRYLANHDVLSGLYNRNYFEDYIVNRLPEAYTVGIFDLDGLKLINDAFGHLEGDKVIKVIADFLCETFTNNLFIARIGGDEFVVLLATIEEEEVNELFTSFDNRIKEYNLSSTIEINVSRAGIIIYSPRDSFEKAFAAAENRMYKRKLNNRTSRKSKVLESIIETLNQKTEETKEHSDRLGALAVKTMNELGMIRQSEHEDILLLAKVHDIGKITIPDHILNKPDKLSRTEFEVIKKHCESGYKIIKNITDSDYVSAGVLSHHENFDGTGYPQGLKGSEISIYARIIRVVDSFDAMTSERVYQKQKTAEEAIKELQRCSGTQFDPIIVDAFITSYKKDV